VILYEMAHRMFRREGGGALRLCGLMGLTTLIEGADVVFGGNRRRSVVSGCPARRLVKAVVQVRASGMREPLDRNRIGSPADPVQSRAMAGNSRRCAPPALGR